MTKPDFRCGRRMKSCRKCKHRFPKAEYELWFCPECGEDRHCTTRVNSDGRACRKHGGESLGGVASPTYQGKGYSKYIPERLRKRYEDGLEPLYDSARLLDMRVKELIEVVDIGDLTQLWQEQLSSISQLDYAFRDLSNAKTDVQRKRATTAFGESVQQLRRGAKAGKDAVGNWKEIAGLLEQKRSIVATQAQIDHRNETSISADDFIGILEQIILLFVQVNELEDAKERRLTFAKSVRKFTEVTQ